jgi:DNA repair photolyase
MNTTTDALRQSGFAPGAFGASRLLPAERRGRGAVTRAAGRYERFAVVRDENDLDDLAAMSAKTELFRESAKSILTRNASPDLPFDRSVNPYRGCEHGCAYCFARPTHAYLGLSPGLDFERKITVKENAAEALEKTFATPGYAAAPLALGANTDPYQPAERTEKVTRAILEVIERFRHPVVIVTKSALVLRDLDILSRLAEAGLVKVALSITTRDARLARSLEPRASTPAKRLEAIGALAAAGVPTAVFFAPVIPALNDHEMEDILKEAREAGAVEARYGLLRLPLEVKDLFREWLVTHAPDRARHVLALIQAMRGGRDYDPRFGQRFTGTGPYAEMIARRFEIATGRLGFSRKGVRLRSDLFRGAKAEAAQLDLFAA